MIRSFSWDLKLLMSDFIARANQLARAKGLTFREACSELGKRSAAKQKADKRKKKQTANWRNSRWDLDYENLN